MREPVPTISVGAIAKLLQALPALGVDAAAVCAEARFDPKVVAEREGRVPLSSLYQLWEAVVARLDRADAALVVAQSYSPGEYGLMGFVCMNCATIGEALRQAARYLCLWVSEPGLRIAEPGVLEFFYQQPVVARPGQRLALEAAVGEILNGARFLTRAPIAPEEVAFSHPAPRDCRGHEAFFKAPVRWAQKGTWLRFSPEQLQTPLPKADPQLAAFLAGLAEQALARAGEASSLIVQLRHLLADVLSRGVPEIEAVARRLAMSERTLRRRLEEEGTSFRELLDQTRAELARGYLRDPNLALSEVAFLLGFSEPSAFHRAFRRWTGQTPAEFRRNPR
jgi:AraC-like DNA-binding protein